LNNATSETKVMMADDPEKGNNIVDLAKITRIAALSPEQIMAYNAKDPVAAAEAMKEKYGSELMEKLYSARLEDQQKYMEMLQKNFGENSDRMTDVMNSALDAMGSTATARSHSHQEPGMTYISGGIPGQTNFINQGQTKTVKICPSCKTENSLSAESCENCGEKL
jgi:hypothetical protein